MNFISRYQIEIKVERIHLKIHRLIISKEIYFQVKSNVQTNFQSLLI